MFAAIDNNIGTFSWYLWPEPLKNRHLGALEELYQTEKGFVRNLLQCFSPPIVNDMSCRSRVWLMI